jgi:photosystem II stability/assembly factor-like uncharacterized protein
MKTPLIFLLVCWSSLALALGGPSKAKGPGLPQSLEGNHTLMSGRPLAHPMVPHSTLGTTNSLGYDPWVEKVTGLPDGTGFYWIQAVDSNTVWAAVYGETLPTVIRTTNGGSTWICDTIKTAPSNCVVAGIYAFDANTACVTMFNPNSGTGGGLFRTTDGGVTWTEDPTVFGSPDFVHFFDASHGVCVGDYGTDPFVIYTTSNAGTTWSQVPSANIPPKVLPEFGLTGGFCAAGNSLWFFTTNGNENGSGRWQIIGRYYRTTDRGQTWTVHVYPRGVPSYVFSLGFQDDNVGLGSGGIGEVSLTTDGGSTWTQIPSPSHLGLGGVLAYVPGTSGMCVAGGVWQYPSLEGGLITGTIYTTNGGASWTGACATKGGYFFQFASASAGWRADLLDQNIYKWTMAKGRVIGTSVDTLNFATLTAGQMSDTIAIDAVNFGSDSLTVSGIVAPGNQYTVVTQPALPATISPLGSMRVGIRFTPNKNGILQDSLVFISNATNAPRTNVFLRGTGTGATSVDPTREMPKAFALEQNYPNPFNPATTIRYALAHRSPVLLTVYNTLGQQVAVLSQGQQQDAGSYELKFDGSNLASGVYFYRLQAGSYVNTRKLLLLR